MATSFCTVKASRFTPATSNSTTSGEAMLYGRFATSLQRLRRGPGSGDFRQQFCRQRVFARQGIALDEFELGALGKGVRAAALPGRGPISTAMTRHPRDSSSSVSVPVPGPTSMTRSPVAS